MFGVVRLNWMLTVSLYVNCFFSGLVCSCDTSCRSVNRLDIYIQTSEIFFFKIYRLDYRRCHCLEFALCQVGPLVACVSVGDPELGMVLMLVSL